MTIIDPAGIGKYGSLKVLKKKTNEFAACFPIDDEELTFGRNPGCGVRLYYPTVSMFHCKIMFSEGQAFLVVMGANGVHVDGTKVFPSMSDRPTVIPLEDGSVIEIQKKRFEYNYPPENYHLQATIDSPFTARHRSLRMSMIEAAQIFTPTAPRMMTPPRGPQNDAAELVARMMEGDGENSVVIESEQDVIVVEQVKDEPLRLEQLPSSLVINKSTSTPVQLSPPMIVTPQKSQKIVYSTRRRSEPSLHKAVLLRSAQRAVQERQREEMEEIEVELAVNPVHFSEDEEDAAANRHDEDIGEIPDDVDEMDEPPSPSQRVKGTLRKSLEAVKSILPFNWAGTLPKDMDEEDDVDEKEDDGPPLSDSEPSDDEAGEEEEDEIAEIQVVQQSVLPSKTRVLGRFLTPQKVQPRHTPRASIPVIVESEGGAHRVPVLDLSDVTAAAPTLTPKRGPQRVPLVAASVAEQQEVLEQLMQPESPRKAEKPTSIKELHDPAASEEEKRQIREKRKSFNPEVFSQLPVLEDWSMKSTLNSSSSSKRDTVSPENEDLNTMLARIQEQTIEMKRKSLARQSIPRRSDSPIKADYAFPNAPPLPPKIFKSTKEGVENKSPSLYSSPTKDCNVQTDAGPPSTTKLASPSRSHQRKLLEMPSLPALDLSTLSGVFKTPRGRSHVPRTPAIKSVRNLFKAANPEPNLETPKIQTVGEFRFKLEEMIDIADTSEIDDMLCKPSGKESIFAQSNEVGQVEEEPVEVVPKARRLVVPKKVSHPQEIPLPPRRARATKPNTDQSDGGQDAKEIGPTRGRAGRVLRSAGVTQDGALATAPADKPKTRTKASGRPVQTTSEDPGSIVKEEIIDTQVPIKSSNALTRTRARTKASTKTETTEDELDELDCLSPAKGVQTRTLRARNEDTQTRSARKTKGAKSDTEVSEISSEEPKSKLSKRSAPVGRATGRKTRTKVEEIDIEEHGDKENSPVRTSRASRVPAAKRVKEVKEEPQTIEEVNTARVTRARAKKLK